ncbi:hypothetical protein [Methylobacterium sp. Leaf117]|uniref:hypothetical protein n=1 Tax=Methylobacterium sp. Leaf117 TaxID=1736260 RepID=UPI000700502E|nr:hypothetical protein [Methylobacterium sp. Leaf117]KQP82855.1 hypothetical protein ASF57_12020 [Methylobacterium sp. Leaf117]
MLKLSPAAEPYWLDLLPGVRIKVRPITIASMLIARDAVSKVFRGEDQEDVGVRANIALVREIAQRGVVEWEGVGDAEGNPAPVNRETIGALLDHWPAYDEIDVRYVAPALERGEEKNGSSSSPAGTTEAAPATAMPAESSAQSAHT